jgi:hypothetical protein
MNELERCEEILIIMADGARSWGKYIEDFIERFSTLNIDQINMLIDTVDAEIRYDFMRQFFGHVRREFNNLDDTKKRRVLNQLYLLVILENCDFDYRENILLAQSFSETTKDYSDIKAEEWNKVSHLATEKLKKYLEAFLSS